MTITMSKLAGAAAIAAAALVGAGVEANDVSVYAGTDATCDTKLNTLGDFKLGDGACEIVPGSTTQWWTLDCDSDAAGSDFTFRVFDNALCGGTAAATDTATSGDCVDLPNAGVKVDVNCTTGAALSPQNTIVNNAVAAGLSTLATVVSITPGYDAVRTPLNSAGSLTVFAPTNDAFAAAAVNTTDVDGTSAVLFYHVLGAKVPSANLQALQIVETLSTDQDYVNVGAGEGQNLRITKSDADGVQLTWSVPTAASRTATVTTADVECSNGIVHVIDSVLLLPETPSATATFAGLTDLTAALAAESLVTAVDTTAQLTIFAPTNAAFDKAILPTDGGVDTVLKEHVVPGAVAFSTDLSDGMELTTLANTTLVVRIDGDGAVSVNGSNVVIANVLTENGVVHVVDKVIGVDEDTSPAAVAQAAAPAMLLCAALLAVFGSA